MAKAQAVDVAGGPPNGPGISASAVANGGEIDEPPFDPRGQRMARKHVGRRILSFNSGAGSRSRAEDRRVNIGHDKHSLYPRGPDLRQGKAERNGKGAKFTVPV